MSQTGWTPVDENIANWKPIEDITPPKPDMLATVGNFAKDVAGGFGAGATQTIQGVSKLINKIPGVGETLAPSAGIHAMDEAATPHNTGEKIGAGVEMAAEMAAGEGAIKSALLKIPELAKWAPLVRIFSGGASSGGVAAAHGEDPGLPAAVGAVTAGVGEALPKIATFLKDSQAKNYEDVLAPTTKANKFTTNKIMPQLQETRPIAVSRQGLADKAAARAEDFGQQIEQKVGTLQGEMNLMPVISGLENLRKTFQVNGVSLRPEADAAIDALQGQMRNMAKPGFNPRIGPALPTIDFQDAVKARRVLDQAVSEAKGFQGGNVSDASLTAMRREFSNSIRGELANAHPDLAKLNAKFSFWKNLSDVLDDTLQRKTGQVGAFDKLKPLIAAAGGMATGGASAAVEAGVAMKVLNSTINSTAWRTVSGYTKGRIADAISSGNFDTVVSLLGKGAAAAAGSQSPAPNPAP